jgi:hypothetical protein
MCSRAFGVDKTLAVDYMDAVGRSPATDRHSKTRKGSRALGDSKPTRGLATKIGDII